MTRKIYTSVLSCAFLVAHLAAGLWNAAVFLYCFLPFSENKFAVSNLLITLGYLTLLCGLLWRARREREIAGWLTLFLAATAVTAACFLGAETCGLFVGEAMMGCALLFLSPMTGLYGVLPELAHVMWVILLLAAAGIVWMHWPHEQRGRAGKCARELE